MCYTTAVIRHEPEIREILERVELWPEQDRVALAYQILRDIRIRYRATPPLDTLTRAIGLGAVPGKPAPDDETVRWWIDEYRMRRYG